MLGSRYTATASTTGTANRNIITVPCIVKIWLYACADNQPLSGCASCTRISSASTPASSRNSSAVPM